MKSGIFKSKDRRKDRTEIPVNAIKKQLEHLAREGKFSAAILATENSYISVNLDSDLVPDQLSILARSIWKMSRIADELNDIWNIQQVNLIEKSGENGVFFHSFEVKKQFVVLICIAKVTAVHSELIENATKGIARIIAE
jgi:hypothetical protein